MAEKRPRPSPTGNTPVNLQKCKKACRVARRLQFTEKEVSYCTQETQTVNEREEPPASKEPWIDEENLALVEFLLLHTPEKWPTTKNALFWSSVSDFVMMRGKGEVKRSGRCMSMYIMECLD